MNKYMHTVNLVAVLLVISSCHSFHDDIVKRMVIDKELSKGNFVASYSLTKKVANSEWGVTYYYNAICSKTEDASRHKFITTDSATAVALWTGIILINGH